MILKCIKCLCDKNENEFHIRSDNNERMNICKSCRSIARKQYYLENKSIERQKSKDYNKFNTVSIREQSRLYEKNRKLVDVNFKLRKLVSSSVLKNIRSITGTKNGKSCGKYLPYSMEELVLHLESLFEIWMTWENHGRYDPKFWDDNNIATWRWQIDHVKPHSTFHYEDIDCEEFRKCWALSNLRPLSAKQNHMDGVSRSRHFDLMGEK